MFFITSIRKFDNFDHRTFGFYSTIEKALFAVENNVGDMWEHFYTHLVIEEFEEGIHPDTKQEIWFQWNLNQRKWNKLKYKKPKRFGCVNWAIG